MANPDFRMDWYGDGIAEAVGKASMDAVQEIARKVRNEAGEMSPYDTGHNAASLAVVPDDGRVLYRREARRKTGFNDPGRHRKKWRVAVATSSGYGGPLEVNYRGAKFTNKAKGKGGKAGDRVLTLGRRGGQYITRALASVMRDIGFLRQAVALATNARLQRTEARARRGGLS
jgi:hypothetical protein